jgi:glutaredoxin 1
MITIYSKNNCGWCTKAKELAETLGHRIEYRNVDTNVQFILELSALKPDVKTLPQIWWDDRYIGGYTDFAAEVENTIGGFGDGKI